VTRDGRPGPLLPVRDITVFRRLGNGGRRAADQRRNVAFEAERASFGEERPLDGLVVLVSRRGL